MTSQDREIYLHYIQDIRIFYNHISLRNATKDACSDLLSHILNNISDNEIHINKMISILISVAAMNMSYNNSTTAYGEIYKYLKCCVRENKLNKLNG